MLNSVDKFRRGESEILSVKPGGQIQTMLIIFLEVIR